MNEAQHTPGPWKAVIQDTHGNITIEANGRSICDIIGTMPVDEDNARLIAAALDMAEALKGLLEDFVFVAEQAQYGPHVWRDGKNVIAARAALAKAGV